MSKTQKLESLNPKPDFFGGRYVNFYHSIPNLPWYSIFTTIYGIYHGI
jgi:hypothetical protein